MSIFKESFQPYVSKQLKIREEIVKGGNLHRFGNPKISFEYPHHNNINRYKLNLPPGAFYTYTTSKQCIIRMSSGVNLTNPNLLENYGFENPNDLLGAGLAIRYILEGGIPAKNIDFGEAQKKFIDGNPSQIKTIPRGKSTRGFARGYGSTYGDPFIRSDAQDGYGIVPMPGIIDANIRTKTAYGSIREAQINFTCHNRRQLEILELLYMRPGFPVLLEWGWTPFINNKGEIIKDFPYYKKWFSKNTNINDINSDILLQKINHSGNYDGFVGYIKNFEISARADGGYDCVTHLTAMGEILEGIKGKRTGKTIKTENRNVYVDDFEFYLKAVKEFAESYSYRLKNHVMYDYNKRQGLNTDDFFPSSVELLESYQKLAFLIDKKPSDYFTTQESLDNIRKNNESQELQDQFDQYNLGEELNNAPVDNTNIVLNTVETPIEGESDEPTIIEDKNKVVGEGELEKEVVRIEKVLDPYIIRKGEELLVNGNLEEDINVIDPETLDTSTFNKNTKYSKSQFTYIRWDFLVNILNNFIIPVYQKNKNRNHPIVEIYQDSLLEYTTYELEKSFINENLSGVDKDIVDSLKWKLDELENYTNISSNPKICLLPHQMLSKEQNKNHGKTKNHRGVSFEMMVYKSHFAVNNRKISNIFFNVDHLLKTYKKMLYDSEGGLKEDFSLFSFLDQIWSDVNQACAGTHNFTLQTDEPNHSNIVRVIDLTYQNKELNDQTKLHEIKIQGDKSIVRDFSYNTTIDNKFSSTIAIAAQAPKSINTLDSLTLEAFNKNIECRFFRSEDNKNVSDKQKLKLKNSYENDLKELDKTIKSIRDIRSQILEGDYNIDKISDNISKIRNLENKILNISLRYGYNGKNANGDEVYVGANKSIEDTHLSNISKSSVIPLKFGCVMDGISGIVIGNVFRVEKSKLPIGYQEDDIAFVVFSEDQKITAGQDWTTELSGQLILLDLSKESPTLDDTQSNSSETENETDNAIKKEEVKIPRRYAIKTDSFNEIINKSGYLDPEEYSKDQIIGGIKSLPNYDTIIEGNFSGEIYNSSVPPDLVEETTGYKYYIVDTIEPFHPEAYAEDSKMGWGYYRFRKGPLNKLVVTDETGYKVLYDTEVTYPGEYSPASPEELILIARNALKQSLEISDVERIKIMEHGVPLINYGILTQIKI